ncbi:MAG TPA: pyruvate kinase [Acidimicrobiales bacterium]|nr:pyruvate kinase [Acidimicrobiales bacterium]
MVTTASEESLGTAEEHAHPAGDGSARDAGRGAHCPQCGALLIAESPADAEQQALVADLAALEDAMLQLESLHGEQISRVHPDHRADAVNLTHYLALRQGDKRSLQRRLGLRGLSSLGRCEPHVLATIESVRSSLDASTGVSVPPSLSFKAGRGALDRNTDALFGPRPPGRVPRVMVTLPSEAASDNQLVRLVASGTDVARINGAHDSPEAWAQMARNVRKASAEVPRPCRISMDLPGPKVRTGPLAQGSRVIWLRPRRDLRGVAVTPAPVQLVAEPDTVDQSPPTLPVEAGWLGRRKPGDVIELVDTKASHRHLRIVQCEQDRATAEAWDTTYVETGSVLRCGADATEVGDIPLIPQFHLLHAGDGLRLTRGIEPAQPWHHGEPGLAGIGCTLPAIFDVAQPDQHVVLDDGKLTATIEHVAGGEILLRIDTASVRGSKLRAEKSINLPEADLRVATVTDADLPLLRVAAEHADMVALSFLHHERDVDTLRDYLDRVGAMNCGLVLKIETREAFARLPDILLHAMQSPLVGVMIARGDLAVEVGYDRLAELQEEILWLCEAAHLPVIWATEVLDHMARTGQPSRAEVTDAAMAQRAECVMLNKGPHIDTAILFLDDILHRMSGHQRKKTALLRPLHSWEDDADPGK